MLYSQIDGWRSHLSLKKSTRGAPSRFSSASARPAASRSARRCTAGRLSATRRSRWTLDWPRHGAFPSRQRRHHQRMQWERLGLCRSMASTCANLLASWRATCCLHPPALRRARLVLHVRRRRRGSRWMLCSLAERRCAWWLLAALLLRPSWSCPRCASREHRPSLAGPVGAGSPLRCLPPRPRRPRTSV